jgi:hypothetical protein
MQGDHMGRVPCLSSLQSSPYASYLARDLAGRAGSTRASVWEREFVPGSRLLLAFNLTLAL